MILVAEALPGLSAFGYSSAIDGLAIRFLIQEYQQSRARPDFVHLRLHRVKPFPLHFAFRRLCGIEDDHEVSN